MLETYFVKPQTVDRIRACWIGAEIERYAGWLSEQGYRACFQTLAGAGVIFARRRVIWMMAAHWTMATWCSTVRS